MEIYNSRTGGVNPPCDSVLHPAAPVLQNMETYRIERLTFSYPNREKPALNDVSIVIKRGEFVTLCGPSGSGKTTLLRHLKPSATPHGRVAPELGVRSEELGVRSEELGVRSEELGIGDGERSGDYTPVIFEGTLLRDLPARDAAAKIGFVMQSPENQIVTDKVWHELAFGLECLGIKTPEIRLRVAEMASFFGIQTWFHKPVTELSGGQKQILTLASIMVLQPSALILDEPTGQLDPIAAGEFLATVAKINRELGVTVIMTEHRLEEALPLSTRALVMDEGRVIADGSPREVGLHLRGRTHGMFLAMPTAMRVWSAAANRPSEELGVRSEECPITVREGADWLARQKTKVGNKEKALLNNNSVELTPNSSLLTPNSSQPAVEMDDVWFKYEKGLPDVVKGLSFKANYGEFTTILGGNGTGKTTALLLIAGLLQPYRGKVRADTTAYMLPQNPQSLFVAKTVREDLLEILSELKMQKDVKQKRLAAMVKLCRLDELLDSHPYDLSGGEQQRAALAKVLLLQPRILLLDEPTKGLDAEFKQVFAEILRKLTGAGVAVIMVSHDVEFCAEHADRCTLFFDGDIVTENTPRAFFSGNSFYTTSANRMARDVFPEAITASDIIKALRDADSGQGSGDRGQATEESEFGIRNSEFEISDERNDHALKDDPYIALFPDDNENPIITREPNSEFGIRNSEFDSSAPKLSGLSTQRKAASGLFAALLLAVIIFAAVNFEGFKSFISGGNEAVIIAAEGALLYVGIMIALAICIIGLTLALTWKRDKHNSEFRIPNSKFSSRRLPRRTLAAAAMILLAIPVTIYVGSYFFGDRKYYFISLLIILETMLPFALVFESRKPQARELVIMAVLCAIAVAGRAAFFMLPQFKPVMALVIIAGVAFGGEAGFLVGAMTGFVSNFFFGQGPWTPYQMFAFGVVGFLSGLLFRKGFLRREPASLAVFGAFATIIFYGGIMNPASMMIWQSGSTISGAMLLVSYLQGVPFDLVHAVATVTFMLIIAKPMLEKLDRIKVKYGLVE